MNIFKAITGFAAAALFAGSVSAAPIAIFEPSDFSNDPFAATAIGTLDFGVNTIGGVMDASAGDFGDAWSADVVIGGTISDVIIHIVGITGGSGVAIFGDGGAPDSFTPIFADGFFSVDIPAGGDFFSDFFVGIESGLPSFEYEWSITVESDAGGVPAPAGILMLIGGLGLIGLGKARK